MDRTDNLSFFFFFSIYHLFIFIYSFLCFFFLKSQFPLKVALKMSEVVGLQVNAEKRRLEEAKLIAESEKNTYVKVTKAYIYMYDT